MAGGIAPVVLKVSADSVGLTAGLASAAKMMEGFAIKSVRAMNASTAIPGFAKGGFAVRRPARVKLPHEWLARARSRS